MCYRQDIHWQWALFGLGSCIRIQIYGVWLRDKILGLFPCFLSSTSPCFLYWQFHSSFYWFLHQFILNLLQLSMLTQNSVSKALFPQILLLLMNKLIGEFCYKLLLDVKFFINFTMELIQFLVQVALHCVSFLIGLDIHCPLFLYEIIK